MLRLFRNAVFLGWFSVSLLFTTAGLALWGANAAYTAARLSAEAAQTALRHRKEIARAVARAKAKARLRRLLVAAPVIGIPVSLWFEEQDFEEWQSENPEGTRAEYLCEVGQLTAEVMDDVLQDLPTVLRPSPATLAGWAGDCGMDQAVPDPDHGDVIHLVAPD